MEAFILDASVALSWRFPNDLAKSTRAILQWIEVADVVAPEIGRLNASASRETLSSEPNLGNC
jgi:hypothetical protein